MIAEVIINSNAKALNRIFDYIVPAELESEIRVGSRVFVSFGKSKKLKDGMSESEGVAKKLDDGFVIELKEESEFANKYIESIAKETSLTEENIVLAKLMSRKYFCNISDCIRLMLPPGTGGKLLETRTKEKVGNFVSLKRDVDEIRVLIENKTIKSNNHTRVLNFLIENDETYISDLEMLTEVNKSVFKTLEKNGHIEIIEKQIERNPFINKKIEKDSPKALTEEQRSCFDGINKSIENNEFSKNLIYGVTGSRENRNIFTINN